MGLTNTQPRASSPSGISALSIAPGNAIADRPKPQDPDDFGTLQKVSVALPRTVPAVSSVEEEYRPFPVGAVRNVLQETLEVPLLVRALGFPVGQRMLEVGCGCGIALVPFARLCKPARLVGLDIDHELLSRAERHLRERGVEAELWPGDVRRMPFPDGSFDIVVDFGTLYHIAWAGEALQEIARILSPGGLFVHETRMSQFVSHPRRSCGRKIPWPAEPVLEPCRTALLWTSRRRRA